MNFIKKILFTFFISVFFIINAEANNDHNKHSINPELKRNILKSPFKFSLHQRDGKKIMAFLYAEDKQSNLIEYDSCIDGEERKDIEKTGHYYLYLYDLNSDQFIETRIPVFKKFNRLE